MGGYCEEFLYNCGGIRDFVKKPLPAESLLYAIPQLIKGGFWDFPWVGTQGFSGGFTCLLQDKRDSEAFVSTRGG